METIPGVYQRKSDGKVFTYKATFTTHEWLATVSLLDGGYTARIRQAVHGVPLNSPMQAQVQAWVESCIENRVGVD